jgi:hypothetical protein
MKNIYKRALSLSIAGDNGDNGDKSPSLGKRMVPSRLPLSPPVVTVNSISPETQGSPHFLRGRGNKRIVDAELFCEKNRGRAIRWEQVHDVQQKIEYRLKE